MVDSSDCIDVKLDGFNYIIWKPTVMAALVYRDLYEHVDGTHPCPTSLSDTAEPRPSANQIAQCQSEIKS